MREFVTEIDRSDADAVLISLVGQDAVVFNRAFGEAAVHKKMVRLSCAIEENGLAACGAMGLQRVYSSSSYFGALQTEANAVFREKYYGLHGDNAPLLNTLGQSIYEGVQFLASLIASHSEDWRELNLKRALAISHPSARLSPTKTGHRESKPMYIARADGIQFEIIKQL